MYDDATRRLASDELIVGKVGVVAGHVGDGSGDERKLYICLYERVLELPSFSMPPAR